MAEYEEQTRYMPSQQLRSCGYTSLENEEGQTRSLTLKRFSSLFLLTGLDLCLCALVFITVAFKIALAVTTLFRFAYVWHFEKSPFV